MKSSEKLSSKKVKFRFLFPVLIILFVSTSLLYSFYKRFDKNDVILNMVVQLTEENHVNPTRINSQFSERVFDAYMKKLDPFKWFLTKEDVQQMEVYRQQIGNQIKNGTYQLYDLSVKLIDKRTSEVQEYYRKILSQPFDFTIDEYLETDPDKHDWFANNSELEENWRKIAKSRTLYQMGNILRAQENQTDPSKIKTMETIESEARENTLKFYNDVFTNLPQRKSEKMFALYVNAIINVFDPHTEYRTPNEKEDFDIRLSGQLEGIGARLVSSDGYVKVHIIIPGSPSWLQGELKAGDHIIKVKKEHEAEPVDIFGMTIEDAVSLIRGKKGTKVTLTVRRDGISHEITITITRDVVIDEETYAKSAILTDPATKTRVGYIDLPSFYFDFSRMATGRTSSTDVAKEIEKLKKDNVHGIILDLRTNTGGSLADVIKMGGFFVPAGPIVQVKANSGSPIVHSNRNVDVQYDGPLVILVSSISASASEILAAAMQDYKRAVIIGSPSTFGKGTVQQPIDLDSWLPVGMNSLRPMGSLTLTIQKYYRINGGSVQLKGVESDIVLPDLYSEMKFGERFEDNHLTWTTIAPASFNLWKDPVKLDDLRRKSAERTSKSEGFRLLKQQADLIREQRENTLAPLNLNAYQQEENKRREESKRFEGLNKQPTALNIVATTTDIAEMKGDTAKIAHSNRWIRDMNKDIIIEEAVRVVKDMR